MDIDRYLADNQPTWAEFDRLAETVRRLPARIGDDELERFLHLHLRTSADLSHVRVAQPEPALVDRLSLSVAAGRTVLEGRRAVSLRTLGRFFTVSFPAAVWRLRRLVAVSAALTFGPAVATGVWIERSPAALEAVAPPALRDAYVNEDFEEYYSDRPASQFATEVTVNNIRVSVMAFAGGMLLGLGTAAILIFNGMNVGFAAGLFAAADQSARFYGLLLPHGLLELTAVVIAGATGLSLGWAMIAPGDRTRGESLIAAAQQSLTVILGLIAAFIVAGIIEGFVTGSTLSTALRVGLGGAVELGFLSYLYVFGRRGALAAAEGGLPGDRTAEPDPSGEDTW